MVTGMTGAGRGTAAKGLEKLGYYVIDNLPAELLESAIDAIERSGEVSRLAIVVDARSGSFFAGLNDALQRLRERGTQPRVLYLEASDDVLVRRQEAARRPHPLSREGRLIDGFVRERELLRRIRGRADIVIDTSNLNVHQLGQRMQAAFEDPESEGLRVSVVSFGFKYGLPIDADMVADMRFLPNPYWVDELRPMSGLDEPVRDYVRNQPRSTEFLDSYEALLALLTDGFVHEDKSFLTVAIGCTGGRHRSVTMAEALGERLRGTWRQDTGHSPRLGPRVKVVALGGGHGLAASLSALRRLDDLIEVGDLTGIVTVADNGGSSGRLRTEFGILPPGDLRMALAALCSDDEWGRTWARILQHRFGGDSEGSGGELRGHSVGNLLIAAAWDILDDHVEGLDLVGELLGARGRVLPMAAVPLDIEADVHLTAAPDRLTLVRGQAQVASVDGQVVSVRLDPADPPACPEAVEAVLDADWVVIGPGSWFTSVMPTLLVPQLRDALLATKAQRALVLNLVEQAGETEGLSPVDHLGGAQCTRTRSAHRPGGRRRVALRRQWGAREGRAGAGGAARGRRCCVVSRIGPARFRSAFRSAPRVLALGRKVSPWH